MKITDTNKDQNNFRRLKSDYDSKSEEYRVIKFYSFLKRLYKEYL